MADLENPAKQPAIVLDPFEVELNAISKGRSADPFQILGPHWIERNGRPALAIRAFLPRAVRVTVIWGSTTQVASKIHPDGIFEAVLSPETVRITPGDSVP